MSKLKIRVLTPMFRVSFPKVFEPEMTPRGKEKYSVVAMFDKEAVASKAYKDITAAVLRCIVDRWGTDRKKWPKALKYPMHDGNIKYNSDEQKYQMYKDVVHYNFSSRVKPIVRTSNNKGVITDPKEFYGGCYAYALATIRYWEYNEKNQPKSEGVICYLDALMKAKDGEAFGGRLDPEAEFESVKIESEADNFDPFDGLGNASQGVPPSIMKPRSAGASKTDLTDVFLEPETTPSNDFDPLAGL